MGCQGTVYLGNNLTFSICTHDPDTGVLTDADVAPSYRVYEDETATPILTGTMSKLDDVNTTGFYTEQIACTTGNGFEDTKTYTIYIEATVDGDTGGKTYAFMCTSLIQDIDDEVDIIHDAVLGMGLSGSAVGVLAASATIVAGSQTNTYANTHAADEIYHRVMESGTTINFYYEFNVGTDGTPVSVTAKGRVDEASPPSGGDRVYIQAYDWVGVGWDTLGYGDGINGSDSTDDMNLSFPLFVKHVGTGADDGKVRIRFYGTAMESGTSVYIDQVFVQYANVLNYAGINAQVDTALSDYDPPTKGEMDAAHAITDGLITTVDGVVDAILADTGTDGVVLADDAITSAKFDESTAFPIKAADSGSTYIARTGADSDTLETLSDQIDTVDADAFWTREPRTLTQAAVSAPTEVSGSNITILRGDTFTATITGLGDITSRSKLWFTVKRSRSAIDSEAIIQIEETDGLIYLNGLDASARPTNASMTVNDESSGSVTVEIDEVETDDFAIESGLYYDIQMLTTGGVVTTLAVGHVSIIADVTRVIV